MKNSLQILLSLFFINIYFAQKINIDSLISEINQNDFQRILRAKERISQIPKIAIPNLIKNMNNISYSEIYNQKPYNIPGSEEIFDCGTFLNYDINWISVRSAWILEEITFQEFGFYDLDISTIQLVKQYEEVYKKKFDSKLIRNSTSDKRKKILQKILAKKVENWWKENENYWSTFIGVKEALTSKSYNRMENALIFLLRSNLLEDEQQKKEIIPLLNEIDSFDSNLSIYTQQIFENYKK